MTVMKGTVMKSMQGGDTVEDSYANNSWFQNNSFHSAAKPRLRDAIHHLIATTLRHRPPSNAIATPPQAAAATSPPERSHIAIADLGCSHGRNTLDCARVVLSAFLDGCGYSSQEESSDAAAFPNREIQYFFSDLPANDFNSLFGSLEPFLKETLSTICAGDGEGQRPLPKIFTAGVPGSFYGRLFPSDSLDLVISSFSLHWLSQIPPSLHDRTSPAWNGGQIWFSNTNPNKAVLDAKAEQSLIDLKKFLNNRVKELASGGILFLFLFVQADGSGSSGSPPPLMSTMDLCNEAWEEMADEGLVTREEADMFNLPLHLAGRQDVEKAVKEVAGLKVLDMETVQEMPFSPDKGVKLSEQWVRFIGSVMRPSLQAYTGEAKAGEYFKRLRAVVSRNLHRFDSGIALDVDVVTLERL